MASRTTSSVRTRSHRCEYVLSVSRMSSCPISLASVTGSIPRAITPRDHPTGKGMAHVVEGHPLDARLRRCRLNPRRVTFR
jgi:hypothetical protein